jgi:hypothetical protein
MSVFTGLEPGEAQTTLERLNKKDEGTRSIITNQALGKQSESRKRQEPINMQRRILMGGALAAAVLSSSGRVLAEENHGGPDNPFILLLKGIYQPVPVGDAPAKNHRDFQGGHNHMVDKLHNLANGSFDEFCFCNISQYQFP